MIQGTRHFAGIKQVAGRSLEEGGFWSPSFVPAPIELSPRSGMSSGWSRRPLWPKSRLVSRLGIPIDPATRASRSSGPLIAASLAQSAFHARLLAFAQQLSNLVQFPRIEMIDRFDQAVWATLLSILLDSSRLDKVAHLISIQMPGQMHDTVSSPG